MTETRKVQTGENRVRSKKVCGNSTGVLPSLALQDVEVEQPKQGFSRMSYMLNGLGENKANWKMRFPSDAYPTSYRAAPPRNASVAEQRDGVNFSTRFVGFYLFAPVPDGALAGAAAGGSLMSIAQRGNA
jgi:hypothetical protein